METIKNLEKIKEFIESHEEEFNKEKLIEYGSTALLFFSGLANRKLIQGIVIGAIVVTAGKLAYDYMVEKAEAAAEKD